MARRSPSFLEDVMDLTSKLPWWVGMTFAVVSYFVLHRYATQEPPKTEGVNALSVAVIPGLLRGLALFGQYLLPVVFLIGAFISALNNFKRKKLYDVTSNSVSANPLEEMSWQDFELLVGEHFRRQGFVVEETAGGADGGVDLIAIKDGQKYLIQCKQWKAYKVGVKVVRELLGVMVGAAATGGFVVTSGEFTRDAVAFAKANNIKLLDGKALQGMMKEQSKLPGPVEKPVSVPEPLCSTQPFCPKCGSVMMVRVAKKGKRVGEKFWGCSKFPACRSIIPIK